MKKFKEEQKLLRKKNWEKIEKFYLDRDGNFITRLFNHRTHYPDIVENFLKKDIKLGGQSTLKEGGKGARKSIFV